jgi:Caspase domain
LKVAEKVAMLIGNADEVLKKPINDILLLAQKLTSVGFKVIPLINLSADDMIQALEMFSHLLEDSYGLNLHFLQA